MEVVKFSISESARKGFSGITKIANEEGVVFLTKNDEPYAMVLPLTIRGLNILSEKFRDSVDINNMPVELRDVYEVYNKLMVKLIDDEKN